MPNTARFLQPAIQYSDEPWIVWCYEEPLTMLTTTLHTDRRSVYSEQEDEILHNSPFTLKHPLIQSNRYHAVLSKLDQKTRKAGAFSAWHN